MRDWLTGWASGLKETRSFSLSGRKSRTGARWDGDSRAELLQGGGAGHRAGLRGTSARGCPGQGTCQATGPAQARAQGPGCSSTEMGQQDRPVTSRAERSILQGTWRTECHITPSFRRREVGEVEGSLRRPGKVRAQKGAMQGAGQQGSGQAGNPAHTAACPPKPGTRGLLVW